MTFMEKIEGAGRQNDPQTKLLTSSYLCAQIFIILQNPLLYVRPGAEDIVHSDRHQFLLAYNVKNKEKRPKLLTVYLFSITRQIITSLQSPYCVPYPQLCAPLLQRIQHLNPPFSFQQFLGFELG